MSALQQLDDMNMLVAETRGVILAISSDDTFTSMGKDDTAAVFHLLLRQMLRMEEVCRQMTEAGRGV